MAVGNEEEIAALLDLSARLGSNPLLVQAGTGNTSIKLDGVLWIKASGKWLADAIRDDIFVPVPLPDVKRSVRSGNDLLPAYRGRSGKLLRSSVETTMHAVLPHRVVIHVHSINTIAWAVRRDGPFQLKQRLAGLNWQWIPYVASGLPLALEIDKRLFRFPGANIFVLANHGLVVCGESCDSCEALLAEVEERLVILPRTSPEPDFSFLKDIAAHSHWRIPTDEALHALGTDPICRKIHSGGVLYPCQAMFLESEKATLRSSAELHNPHQQDWNDHASPFLIVERSGVLVGQTISRTERAMLSAYVGVLQRLGGSVPIRYLDRFELEAAMRFGNDHYGVLAEANQTGTAVPA
jgi:rhamnose utilization protein RhaD (predicted bifunctional aldolase and dehydrogenase)